MLSQLDIWLMVVPEKHSFFWDVACISYSHNAGAIPAWPESELQFLKQRVKFIFLPLKRPPLFSVFSSQKMFAFSITLLQFRKHSKKFVAFVLLTNSFSGMVVRLLQLENCNLKSLLRLYYYQTVSREWRLEFCSKRSNLKRLLLLYYNQTVSREWRLEFRS